MFLLYTSVVVEADLNNEEVSNKRILYLIIMKKF